MKKKLSKEHEEFVARWVDGRRSPSSGASVTDKGDVKTDGLPVDLVFECKGKFGERTGQTKVKSVLVNQMEKVADEAWSEDKDPAIALRFYMPDSTLADSKGYVDLIVFRMADYEVR
jgi:hypothetical protein